ncbi:MAG: exodeoxyribonuclease V subunit gamma [Clostridiales Family XIII bacterium]|jgi:ATP-dependent helicase/nuclease subunit B|nr:exodeoxyribonuclease V subunit gamma [Clostridiales Family XIII bacterium]
MLNIYCGREDRDKEAFLFSLIDEEFKLLRESGNADGRILLVVPDQFTLEAERGAFFYLKYAGFMEIEIISLSRLRQRVLEETGGDSRIPISKTGRHMLLSVIIRKEAKRLESFSDSHGLKTLAEMMNDLISEMKLYNISPDDVKELYENEKQPVLKRKLADILRIYSSYEELTHGKYMDSEDHLAFFTSKLPKSRMIKNSSIWMYGFDSFSPKDMDIIKGLIGNAAAVNIVLTTVNGSAPGGMSRARADGRTGASAEASGYSRADVVKGTVSRAYRDDDVFKITQRLAGALCACAREAGKRYSVCDIYDLEDSGRLAKPAALVHIEKEIFSYPYRVYRGAAPELTMLAAANYYAEAESAAAEITRMIREEGKRYRDILVICNDLEKRGAVIRRVFSEYDLPIFMDKRRNLLHNPVLEYISALMDITAGNWRTEDVIRLMKTGVSPIDAAQCEILDEYAVKYRVRGKSGWTHEFERLSPYDFSAVGSKNGEKAFRLRELNEARASITSHIMKFIEIVAGTRSVAERTGAIYLFLRDEAKLPEKLMEKARNFRLAGREERAEELSQVWTQVVDIFDQMAAILGEVRLSREDYADLLAAGLESIEIGLIPTKNDQILVGTMQRTRTGRVDALFVLGANDGVLPANSGGDGLLNEDERAHIFEGGRLIGKLDALMAEEEQLAIYRNLSRANQRIWMSYSVSDHDGNELRPSLIFEKLRRMFPGNAVEKDIRSGGAAMDLVNARESTLVHLTAAIREMADGGMSGNAEASAPAAQAVETTGGMTPPAQDVGASGGVTPPAQDVDAAGGVTPPADVWLCTLGWYRRHDPDRLKPIEAGVLFSNRRERIGREYVKRLYGLKGGGLENGSFQGESENPERIGAVIRLSPSGLERYARCPFSHFITYGLRPAEKRMYEIGPRERGDLFHKVLMNFSKELTTPGIPVSGEGSKWMEVSRSDCESIVDGIFAGLLENSAGDGAEFAGIFRQGRLEQYRTSRIRTVAGMAAWIVAEQVKAGLIEEMFFEEGFGAGKNFPPVVCRTDKVTEVRIEGQIDRIDVIRGGRAKIIDYKSGEEKFDIDEAREGWRLQLMLYLEAATSGAAGRRLKPAGAFYFKVAEPRLDCGEWSADESDAGSERAMRELRKSFRMDGVAVDEQDVLCAIAGTEFDGLHFNRGYSDIIPVKLGQDEISGETRLVKSHPASRKLLNEEEFEQLRKDVGEKVYEFCKNLTEGVIDVAPGSVKENSACRFCGYGAICCYIDKKQEGGR